MKKKKGRTNSITTKRRLLSYLDVRSWFRYDSVARNMPYIFFLAALAIVYIWNRHGSERNLREMNKINLVLNERMWEYTTTSSELMNRCKPSEVARAVAPLGLIELSEPPKKIIAP